MAKFETTKGNLKKAWRNAQIATHEAAAVAGLAAGIFVGDTPSGVNAHARNKFAADAARVNKAAENTPKLS